MVTNNPNNPYLIIKAVFVSVFFCLVTPLDLSSYVPSTDGPISIS